MEATGIEPVSKNYSLRLSTRLDGFTIASPHLVVITLHMSSLLVIKGYTALNKQDTKPSGISFKCAAQRSSVQITAHVFSSLVTA